MEAHRRPPREITPGRFFADWFPAELARLGGASSFPDMLVRITLEGEGGGTWSIRGSGDGLKVDAGATGDKPLVTLLMLASSRLLSIGPVLLLGNLYLLILGGAVLRDGLHSGQLPRINAGLGILSALIAVRFFDSQLPFTVRGVLFILIGFAFLAVNLLVKRREVRA